MRRVLIHLLTISAASAGLLVMAQTDAQAGTKCEHVNPATGICVVYVNVPTSQPFPVSNTGGSNSRCYWDPAKQHLNGPPARPVPCTSPQYGFWSNTYNCYVHATKPQPPAGDPNWRGHRPGDGAVYDCYQPQTDMTATFWSQNTPAGSGGGLSPRDVAQLAIKRMNLSAIQIGIVPRPGSRSVGLVGMPVWMWAQNPVANTYGPVTTTASAAGITITATARVSQITWDMGDGSRVTCRSAGRPYLPSYGQKASPDCGYRYQQTSAGQPGGQYTVTATSDWIVTWSGAGQTGTVQLNGLTRSTHITIGEAQVLVN